MKLEKRHMVGLVVLVAIGTVVVIAYAAAWQLIFLGTLLCIGSALGIVLVLVALIVQQKARIKDSKGLSRVGTVILMIGIFLLIQGAYAPIALGILTVEVNRARNFVNALIPQLEAYEDQNGAYPVSLDAVLTGNERVPRLLQLNGNVPINYDNRQYYFQQGETYGFRFYVPNGFIGYHFEYCCGVDGEWTDTD